ncbi:MAG: nucleotidyltransferase family protein [Nanoarchaeota archaeon]|nr:nucleotidyltransferase family protein [Nanoarchaeota archaeon]MBU0977217.1 nucleotidyltransferase family protein [Nanoarchaeota archaeon]
MKKPETRNQDIEKVKPIIVSTLKKHGVKKAGIFGSYARGEQNKKSDIDILIEPPKNIGLGFVSINLELEDKLKRKVDLLTYRSINALLKKRILKEEVRIL